ncbi:MAG: hypothetical protein JWM57_2472 [Phycisphaerales bacterium]|nr:hypothetical protein [Phycisphaerales bacterium]
MKLPVTSEASLPSPAALWRRFSDVLFDHALALGEEIELQFARGVIATSPANVVVLPSEPVPRGMIEAIFAAYRAQGKAPGSVIGPLAFDAALLPGHCVGQPHRLMRLRSAAARADAPAGVMILPARAAIPHFQSLSEQHGGKMGAMLLAHLDDAQYDALLALRDGQPIAAAALQTRGQTGLVCDVLAADGDFSSAVVGALLGRIIELAARSQLMDVFTAASPADTFYEAAGFVPVADFGVWSVQA